MEKAKPGDWYFGVVCKKYGEPILLFHDKSKGKKDIKFDGPGKLKVTCANPKCRHEDLYGTAEVQRFQVKYVH